MESGHTRSDNGWRVVFKQERPIGKPCLWRLELRSCWWISASFNRRAGLLSSLSSSEGKKEKAVSFDDQASHLISEQALWVPFSRFKEAWFYKEFKFQATDLESNYHVVLVHGGGFGAWCWYKTISLLLEADFKVYEVDLTGSSIHYSDTNSVRNLAEYVKPLSDISDMLGEGDRVCDSGGACISCVMESFPSKAVVFIAAIMQSNGRVPLVYFLNSIASYCATMVEEAVENIKLAVSASQNQDPCS
ncbi:methylesterase 18-like [Populus nigra]|uniref:methylesterase 18-like n=1 Tax=Populus nigra TaxID=3691 RepID=UPI002B26DE38|nr:methylesterase 18-like [Populus nigra]